MTKPKFDKARPLSWSAISSFEYDPEQWYAKYVLKQEQLPTHEMLFGSAMGQQIAADDKFLPELPRGLIYEHEMRTTFGGIPLIGFADSYSPKEVLHEYKTGKRAWDQKRVDGHGQLDMYLLMLLNIEGVRPETLDVWLHWLPTEQNGDFSIQFCMPFKVHSFKTKRTTRQVLEFGTRIKSTYKAMQEYTKSHA